MRLYVGLALLLVPALLLTACGGEEGTATPEGGDAAAAPSKEALVGVLNDLHAAIVAKDYDTAKIVKAQIDQLRQTAMYPTFQEPLVAHDVY